ncbi:MAG: GGDEF domain-containing protein [Chitinivorax sp.]
MLQAKAVLDTLSNLTRLRDRDALEVGLAATVFGLLQPQCLRFWRVIENRGTPALAQCLSFDDDSMLHVPQAQLDPELLRPIDQWPAEWQAACSSGEYRVLAANGTRHLLLPLQVDFSTSLLVEVESTAAELADDAPLIVTLLQLYANHLRLLDYAEKDTLTGLLNRKTFETQFSKLLMLESLTDEKNRRFHQRRRHQDSYPWIGVVDIDHFKRINDRFGHLYGDEVLILMANLMRRAIRANDWLYRFGGEEFVVVLAPATAQAAQEVFTRLRQSIESAEFPQVGQVTASIGYTSVRPHLDSSSMLGEADEALYFAKDRGRNQICAYADIAGLRAADSRTTYFDAELF